MKSKCNFFLLLCLLAVVGCQRKSNVAVVSSAESKEAKSLLQGIWLDAETEEVKFEAKGDTIYHPDSTSVPAAFKVINDTLFIGQQGYPIVKQTTHLLWFQNQAGDVIKLVKSDDPNDALAFRHGHSQTLSIVSELQKMDSVVVYGGERYHWYITINPTRYRVTKTTYTDDGVGVENIYFDNIIHVSVYKGAQKLFSRDFKKQMYGKEIPEEFLSQAVLGNMQFDSVDQQGFHFNATLCIPDGAACYMVSTSCSFDGELSMKLMEY